MIRVDERLEIRMFTVKMGAYDILLNGLNLGGDAMEQSDRNRLVNEVSSVLTDTTPQVYQEVLHLAALRRPFRPPHLGLQNVIDQVSHMAFAVLVFLPVLFWPSYWAAALGGFLLGAIREIEQYKGVDLMLLMLRDRLQDAFFFALGAVLIYHLSR